MPSTTEALLDVNVLIASVFEDHAHYMRATAFVRSLDHFYTSPTTQGGFLRFASRPWKNAEAIEQPPRLTIATAHTKLTDSEISGVAAAVVLVVVAVVAAGAETVIVAVAVAGEKSPVVAIAAAICVS